MRKYGMNVVNHILKPEVLSQGNKKKGRPGLVSPIKYYEL